MLCSEQNGEKPGYALDFQTIKNEDGESVLSYATPVSFDDWMLLPIREDDLSIMTSRGPIRAPLIVICSNYEKVPMNNPQFGRSAVAQRDGWRCGYTDELLTRETLSMDHIRPRSRGGKDQWDNVTSCHKRVNQMKGDRYPHEVGLKLLRTPKAPPSTPRLVRPDDLHVLTRDQQLPFVLK